MMSKIGGPSGRRSPSASHRSKWAGASTPALSLACSKLLPGKSANEETDTGHQGTRAEQPKGHAATRVGE